MKKIKTFEKFLDIFNNDDFLNLAKIFVNFFNKLNKKDKYNYKIYNSHIYIDIFNNDKLILKLKNYRNGQYDIELFHKNVNDFNIVIFFFIVIDKKLTYYGDNFNSKSELSTFISLGFRIERERMKIKEFKNKFTIENYNKFLIEQDLNKYNI
jgi:hypothetical protein